MLFRSTVLTKNRERLQEGDVFEKFMTKLLKHEKVKPLLSDEHFSVDGTLIEAWTSHKSFKPKQAKTDDDGSNFHGQCSLKTAVCASTGSVKMASLPSPITASSA